MMVGVKMLDELVDGLTHFEAKLPGFKSLEATRFKHPQTVADLGKR